MSQNPGDIPVPPIHVQTALVDEDAAMYNPLNGQQAQYANITPNSPNPIQPQPQLMTDANFANALLQELIQSRHSSEQVITMLLTERNRPPAPTPRPTGENGGKKLAADPQPFDGSSGKLEEFLSDLRLCFLADN
jgi:hypothetical protein